MSKKKEFFISVLLFLFLFSFLGINLNLSNQKTMDKEVNINFNDNLRTSADEWHNMSLEGITITALTCHGETNPITKYSSFVSALEYRGAKFNQINNAPLSLASLDHAGTNILWIDDYGSSPGITQKELDTIEIWVKQYGGNFIITRDYSGTGYAAYYIVYQFNFTLGYSGYTSGSTSTINPHPVTNGTSSIYFSSTYRYLNLGSQPLAVSCVSIGGYTRIAAMEYGYGSLVIITESFPYYTGSADNFLLLNNTFGWLSSHSLRSYGGSETPETLDIDPRLTAFIIVTIAVVGIVSVSLIGLMRSEKASGRNVDRVLKQ